MKQKIYFFQLTMFVSPLKLLYANDNKIYCHFIGYNANYLTDKYVGFETLFNCFRYAFYVNLFCTFYIFYSSDITAWKLLVVLLCQSSFFLPYQFLIARSHSLAAVYPMLRRAEEIQLHIDYKIILKIVSYRLEC